MGLRKVQEVSEELNIFGRGFGNCNQDIVLRLCF